MPNCFDRIIETTVIPYMIQRYHNDGGRDPCWCADIYADYNTSLCDKSIEKIMESENPMDSFEECVSSVYEEHDFYEVDEILNELQESLSKDDFHAHEEAIRDWLYEHIYYNLPYAHYLQQKIIVDIVVDTGDGNYDYSINRLLDNAGTIDNKSSLLWLAKEQGYTKSQLKKAVFGGNYSGSKLLESLQRETENTSSYMNALTFFTVMSLDELIGAQKSDLQITKGTPCGLVDYWYGAGGCLEIELEKDLLLRHKWIDSVLPDGCRGYAVKEIYGMCDSFWSKGCVKAA